MVNSKYLKICIILLTVWYTVPVLGILGICQLFHLDNFCILAILFCFILSLCICMFKKKFSKHVRRIGNRYFVKKKHKFLKA